MKILLPLLALAMPCDSEPAKPGPSAIPVTTDPSREIREDLKVGSQVQTKLHLSIRGTIKADGKEDRLAGQALLVYTDRVLEVGQDDLPTRVVRYYDDARGTFVIGTNQDPRQLRPGHRLVVGEHSGTRLTLWTPGGPLTSEEREITEDILDTTRLAGLLPDQPAVAGQSWSPPDALVQALVHMDALIESGVKCTLGENSGTVASIQVTGPVQGLASGANVTTQLDATMRFDLENQVIREVTWKQSDTWGPGPVSPPGTYEVTIRVEREAGSAEQLSDAALDRIPLGPHAGPYFLLYQDPKGRFQFLYERDWHLTLRRPDVIVLRRLTDGELVEQLNVLALPADERDRPLDAPQFIALVQQGDPGQAEEMVHIPDLPTEGRHHLQSFHAQGEVDEVPVAHRHYLATSPGMQVLFSFLMDPENAQGLEGDDFEIVHTLQIIERTASKP